MSNECAENSKYCAMKVGPVSGFRKPGANQETRSCSPTNAYPPAAKQLGLERDIPGQERSADNHNHSGMVCFRKPQARQIQ